MTGSNLGYLGLIDGRQVYENFESGAYYERTDRDGRAFFTRIADAELIATIDAVIYEEAAHFLDEVR